MGLFAHVLTELDKGDVTFGNGEGRMLPISSWDLVEDESRSVIENQDLDDWKGGGLSHFK